MSISLSATVSGLGREAIRTTVTRKTEWGLATGRPVAGAVPRLRLRSPPRPSDARSAVESLLDETPASWRTGRRWRCRSVRRASPPPPGYRTAPAPFPLQQFLPGDAVDLILQLPEPPPELLDVPIK